NNVIETNLEERQKEAARAEDIVADEVRNFFRWLEAQQVTPTIVMLRKKFEEIKNAEVAKAIAMLGAEDPKTKKVVESMASAILNKVLHPPITALKKDVDGRSVTELVATVRELFDLSENGGQTDAVPEEPKGREGGKIG
ncbi:MAG: glutamyl-tRNA reductase, partial [Deltaproteobacteria bacterium]